MPSGTSTSPVFLIFPTREKILVPVLPGIPILAYSLPPRLMINGYVGEGLNVIDASGTAVDTPLDGIRGRWRGSPIKPSTD